VKLFIASSPFDVRLVSMVHHTHIRAKISHSFVQIALDQTFSLLLEVLES
jgi:hypothetical protein